MKIGAYTVSSIVTSTFALDGGAMFGVVPKSLWAKQVEVDELNRISMVTRTLLLESADRKILVDTGNGDKWQQKQREIFKIQTANYTLPVSLAQHGLTPDDITDVICTHLHFDHVGGNTRFDGERIVPVFPRATYWVQAENWSLAQQPHEKDRASYLAENWVVLAENGMVSILRSEHELFDSIKLELIHGHTRGQQLPVISDTKTTLFYGGDLLPLKAHIPIPWVMAYDNEPLISIQEKKRILPGLLKRDAIIFFEHDPTTIACKLELGSRGIVGGENIVI